MLISYSETPLVLDAAGALKVTHFHGRSARDEIYSYFRAVVRGGDLVFSLTSFEQHPPRESRMGAAFCFAPAGGTYLFVSTNSLPQAEAYLCAPAAQGRDRRTESVALPAPVLFGGSDEQGFYWGCEFVLEKQLLADRFGAALVPGSVFTGNIYKYAAGEDAFGAALPTPPALGLPCQAGFGEFVVVPY